MSAVIALERCFVTDDRVLVEWALEVGLLRPGQPLPDTVRHFAYFVAERCATIAEELSGRERAGTIGDVVRAHFDIL